MVRLAGIAGLLLVVCACAPRAYTRSDLEGRVVCDADRMETVERTARRNNTHVEWVNCPTVTLRVVS